MAEEESAKNISNAEQYISILNYKTKGYIKPPQSSTNENNPT